MSHILYGQSRVLVFCIDPDDAVAKAAQGEDGTGREGCAWDSWSTRGDSLIKRVHLLPLHQFKHISRSRRSGILLALRKELILNSNRFIMMFFCSTRLEEVDKSQIKQ